jgi:hypothetical protein
MEHFDREELEESFARFERAAAKGHEESIWILSVVKDLEMKMSALKEAFAETEEPLGWYFAGQLSYGRERFDFWKKSAEGGCSWGQVQYGEYFEDGEFVDEDMEVYVEWLEKAANQNNPMVMHLLGSWFGGKGGNEEKTVSFYRAAAELGWKISMNRLAYMLRDGEGCVKDLRQAVIWSAKGNDSHVFWHVLAKARRALNSGATEDLDCDFYQLCFSLGWGMYWYQYEMGQWKYQSNDSKVFGERCLDYYCYCVEVQQESIFTFLLFWNRMTGGVKGPGQMIAQMVWEGKESTMW